MTYAWQVSNVRDALANLNAILELFGQGSIPAWKAVAWLFYNAHFVTVTYPLPGAGSKASQNLISSSEGNLTLLYLLPPLLLVLAGLVVALAADTAEPVDGLKAGLAVVPGYFVLAVLGVFLTVHSIENASIGVDAVTGVLLAGLVYPAAFGGIGGALGSFIR
ncbi:transporter [Halobacteriaceae archaeon GCM10025711]